MPKTVAAMVGLTNVCPVVTVSGSPGPNVATLGSLEAPGVAVACMAKLPPTFAAMSPGLPVVPARTSKTWSELSATDSSGASEVKVSVPGVGYHGPALEIV